jgi:CMP-N-acetylneuraminic acid synthetase
MDDIVFIIPARKGSKRITAKNLCSILGKPLIEYSFECASFFKGLYPVFITTDDDRIAEMARQFGFSTILRPPELADDKTKMSDVLAHAMTQIPIDTKDICVLYPTNPLRNYSHIVDAIKTWKTVTGPEATLMSVSPVTYRPFGLMTVENGVLKCAHPYGELFYQGQTTPPLYRANGAIYIIPASVIRHKQINSQLFNKATIPFIMDSVDGFEIDDPVDIPMAETLMRFRGLTRV